ncbi:septum site-determining protein MinC [Leucothrix pacifica]|uniref:Probable septum site-determining protein MinC n=2 Tax=Leucothrix pacifica TaxID=1247513 RepID=A0A317CL93_9GAMM|nr:septum site-determining protein MinC [Leucothrix pacifica]
MEIKGEMSMLNVLHLHSTNVKEIADQLEKKRDEVPSFFLNSPVIVDCSLIVETLAELDLAALKQRLIDLMFVPVGVRGVEPEQQAAIIKAGWSVLRAGPKSSKKAEAAAVAEEASESDEVKAPAEVEETPVASANISKLIEKPVRSGQQVFVEEGDAVLLTHTSAGSEVMASGSVHVYGALRGRVLAGVHGDTNARIFCRSLDAELIAIAGRYQLLDEGDTDLRGKPAMIRLDGEKLIIEALD